jgi:hypothetical protein
MSRYKYIHMYKVSIKEQLTLQLTMQINFWNHNSETWETLVTSIVAAEDTSMFEIYNLTAKIWNSNPHILHP